MCADLATTKIHSASPLRVAVLGIGLMGFPMARRLCRAKDPEFEVHVWNRTKSKAEPLAAEGAQVHDQAVDAVQSAEFVISLLDNGAVVEDVLFGSGKVAQAMKPGSLFIDMASIRPREAREHAERLQRDRDGTIAHLDAPVSGGTVGAEAGTLSIMAGGNPEDFERARPVFAPLGKATHVGSNHGAGQLAKLANQMIVGITVGAVAEALLFAAKGGADIAKVREALMGGFADSRVLQLHGQRMIDRDFVARGRLNTQLKDLRNTLATAQEFDFVAPATTLFESLYSSGVEHGFGELDHTGIFLELARRNGME